MKSSLTIIDFPTVRRTEPTSVTVAQLIDALAKMPPTAVVLYEGDEGYALIGNLSFLKNGNGIPDEVILHPDMNE